MSTIANGIGEVVGIRRDDGPVGGFWLRIRYFNGENGPEINAGAVRVLSRDDVPETRPLRVNRWGLAEDPRGYHVIWGGGPGA